MELKVVRLNNDLPLPKYQTLGSAGMDLYANVEQTVIIKAKEFKLIPTGIKLILPEGYEGQIRPRSGLALNYGITCLNSPGTIDTDYTGEIKIILINLGENAFEVKYGDRIAQLVINKFEQVEIKELDNIDIETERGENGFGHTGI